VKKTGFLVSAVALVGVLVSGFALAADAEKAVKARQGLMQIYAFNMSIVGGMAKGAIEYNAQSASAAAENLLALASMKNGAMWPAGSGNDNLELADKTRALPEIWTTYPEIGQKGADMISALEEFVTVAGSGLDGLRGGLKAVGDSCKGCHQDFRAEDD